MPSSLPVRAPFVSFVRTRVYRYAQFRGMINVYSAGNEFERIEARHESGNECNLVTGRVACYVGKRFINPLWLLKGGEVRCDYSIELRCR